MNSGSPFDEKHLRTKPWLLATITMSTITQSFDKRTAIRRFFRSYFGRAIIALVLIGIICLCLLGQVIAGRQKEERIAQKIRKAGGKAYFSDNEFLRPLGSLDIFKWHYRCTHVNLTCCEVTNGLLDELTELCHLVTLYLDNTSVTDSDLEHLRGLDQLCVLRLRMTKVTDSGLEHLRGMTNLWGLNLADTNVSNSGLERLKGMNIVDLDLLGTAVTEAGLEHLKELPNLTTLRFDDIEIGDAEIEHLKRIPKLKQLTFSITPMNQKELQKALPNCTIRP